MVPECDRIELERRHRFVHRMFERARCFLMLFANVIPERRPLKRIPVIEQERVRLAGVRAMLLNQRRDFRQPDRVIDFVLEVIVVRDVRM